jgi:voltage-gated potassium channel
MTQILGPAAFAQYREGLRVRKARRMKDHIILCGDSDTARVLLERLPKDHLLIVAKDKARAESLTASGFAVVAGDYETAEALRLAGVETSRAVIAASVEDSENAFVCLTAKALAPNVPVLATASSKENLDKLRAVRADHIVSPALLSAAEIIRTLAPVGAARGASPA